MMPFLRRGAMQCSTATASSSKSIVFSRVIGHRWRHGGLDSTTRPGSSRLSANPSTQVAIQGPSRKPEDVDDLISKICSVQDLSRHALTNHRVTVFSGTGSQLGLESTWRVSVASNGAFREEIKTKKFTSICGYDGRSGSLSWSGDHTGLAQSLELDDHELALLVNWVRSGLWLSPVVREMLRIDVLSYQGPNAMVRIAIKGGRVNGMMTIDMTTMQPLQISFDLRSDSEVIEFFDWKVWNTHKEMDRRIQYPGRIHYETMSGVNVLNVEDIGMEIIVQKDSLVQSSLLMSSFSIPEPPDIALDTEFEKPTCDLPAWVTTSGHVLVKASINGQHSNSGYWLFDTGASGSVIDTDAASKLYLDSFGSFRVKGMAGNLDGTFRECKSLHIGPLKVKDMLMMEMDCSGLVRGGPGPIVGIIGCDIMSRAVFDIPQISKPSIGSSDDSDVSGPAAAMALSALQSKKSRTTLNGAKEIVIRMSDPRIAPSIPDESKWLGVRWISSLPHLAVTCVNGDVQGDVLFMIDSGAGGMQLMMNGLTAGQLDLLSPNSITKGTRTVRGVGGSSGSNIKLSTKTLTKIVLGDRTLEEVDCLVADEGIQGGVELSHYTGGVLCNDILVGYRFIVDLPRDRMALL